MLIAGSLERPVRTQVGHARRDRRSSASARCMCALATERRHGDRRTGGDGPRRGGIRAGDAVGDPAAVPGPRAARAGARRLGRGLRTSARAGPGHRRPAGRRGRLARVFWFNLGLGASCSSPSPRFVPNSRATRSPAGSTCRGFVLGTGGLGCLIFAAISGEHKGYGTGVDRRAVRGQRAGLLAFVPVELRVTRPMLDLRYIRNPDRQLARCSPRSRCTSASSRSSSSPRSTSTSRQLLRAGKLAGMFAPMAAAIVLGGAGCRAAGWPGSGSRHADGRRLRGQPPPASLLARHELGQRPDLTFGLLAARARRWPALGFGITVVPLTSAVLRHVPAAALRHGGLGDQHRTAARRGGRRGRARRDRQRAPDPGNDFGTHVRRSAAPSGSEPRLMIKLLETGGDDADGSISPIPPVIKRWSTPATPRLPRRACMRHLLVSRR